MNGSEFSRCLYQWGEVNHLAEYYGQCTYTLNVSALDFAGEVSMFTFYSVVNLMDDSHLEIPIGYIQDIYFEVFYEIQEIDDPAREVKESSSLFDLIGKYLIGIVVVVVSLPLLFRVLQIGMPRGAARRWMS